MKSVPIFALLVLSCSLAQAQSAAPHPKLQLRTPSDVVAPQVEPEGTAITVPAGTHVMMQLVSPLDTESAVSGSGVYLETSFPVISENRVVVPARTQVQGVIEAEKRAGRVRRAAEFQVRFISLIFANGYTAPIEGALQSIPGSSNARVEPRQSKVERVDQLDKTLVPVAGGAVIGGVVGSLHHTGLGTWRGAAWGAGLATGAVVITRGDSIHLPEGTKIEMVLVSPVELNRNQIAEALRTAATTTPARMEPPAAALENPSANRTQKPRLSPGLTGLVGSELLRRVWR